MSQSKLTSVQKYFCRVLFHNKILELSGTQFEDFFVSVMVLRYPDFTPIKPQGSKGDQGNDGFVPEEGRYYQCYAPEDLNRGIEKSVDKATGDFGKIFNNWQETAQIKEYRFVFNDRFKGVYPDIEHALAKVKKDYKLDSARPFIAKDLEAEFFKLSDDEISSVLQTVIPPAEYLQNIDFEDVTEILQYLVSNREPFSDETKPISPDFDEKIEFNEIDQAAFYLTIGNFQNGAVENFFNTHGDFTRTHIRDLMASAYNEALGEAMEIDGTSQGDRIFFRLLSNISPNQERSVQDAAIVLIAYFFEKCDVFERPPT